MNRQKTSGGIFSSKKFKYGSVSAGLTVVFVALVILFNAVFSGLSDHYGFSVDLTSQQLYGISDRTRELLADQTKEVSIKFMRPLDQLESSSYYPVVTCAQTYAREFPNVKLEYFDIVTRPDNLNYFTGKGYTVSQDDVIIQCGDEFKIFTLQSFLPVSKDNPLATFAFRGEMYFTSAILSVTRDDKPEVTFTTNHNESVPSQLEEIFELCGYKVNRIDLTTEKISEKTDILVIYDPIVDFHSSEDGESEIQKLSDFLNSNKSVMIFTGPSAYQFPNLDELMEEWGIRVNRAQVIEDDNKSLPGNNTYLVCDHFDASASESETAAAVITGGSVSGAQVVSSRSAPIELVPDAGEFRVVESVLSASLQSYVENDGKRINGPFNVMAVSTRSRYVNNGNSSNQEVRAHLLVSSCAGFASLCNEGDAYANRALLFNAIKLMSEEDIITGISMKRVDDTSLNIRAEQVRSYTIVMASVLPGLVVIGGVVVWIKRKHL